MNRLFFLSMGFLIWLAATIAFRVAGQHFFLYDNTSVVLLLYASALIGIVAVVVILVRWQGLTTEQSYQAAILLALPGMVLDVFAVEFFADIYPNMDTAAAAPFGAWLLWAYAAALIAPFWLASRTQ